MIKTQEALTVTKPTIRQEGDKSVVSFFVNGNGIHHEVWFKTQNLPEADYSNVALAATLLPAMKLNMPLRIEGVVSPKLLQGVSKIQEIFNVWYPDMNQIEIEFLDQKKAQYSPDGIGCFFSGGVDSFYSILKHQKQITSLIFVHGFDIELTNVKLRDKVITTIRKAAQALKKPLIEVETNLRDFSNQYVKWGEHYLGAALATVSLLLSTHFKKIIIPSGDAYGDLHAWGSHPLIDPLWSTEATEIILDGCEATRVKKVEAITKNEVAMSYLRVCWENREGAYNCEKCEKCLRTMVNLLVVDAFGKCKTFTRPLDLSRVARIKIDSESSKDFILENLNEVRSKKTNQALQGALEDCISGLYYKGTLGWPKRIFNFLRRGGIRRAISI